MCNTFPDTVFLHFRLSASLGYRYKKSIFDIRQLKPTHFQNCLTLFMNLKNAAIDPTSVKDVAAIQLIVADDHAFILDAICDYIKNRNNGIEVIGRARNGLELMDTLKEVSPEIILLDLRMPDVNGFEALKLINNRYPKIKIIVYSNHYTEHYFKEVILLGASSYLSKSAPTELVMDTIKKVAREGFSIKKEI